MMLDRLPRLTQRGGQFRSGPSSGDSGQVPAARFCWLRFGCTLLVTILMAHPGFAASAPEGLAGPASWRVPELASLRDQCLPWLLERAADPTIRTQLEQLWMQPEEAALNDGKQRGQWLLTTIVRGLALVDPRAAELQSICQQPRPAHDLPSLPILQDDDLPAWATANLRLVYGTWLADQQLYDEAHEQLESLKPADVVDPAALLFYQGAIAYRRLERNRCLEHLTQLEENAADVAERYRTVAQLMRADFAPFKPDTLDEISRMMENIKVRLGHGRAGVRVRTEEDEVIAKLDKLIEQAEQQAAAAAASASSAGGSSSPAQPMQDSGPGGGTGPGNVNPRRLGTDTDWGNLPPREREEALQELSRDLPSHYRDVIEEYFRKLAREKAGTEP